MKCQQPAKKIGWLKNRLVKQMKTSKTTSGARNGFTMVEVLLGCMAAMMIAGILLLQASTINRAMKLTIDDQEQFAILQIRQMVSLAKAARIESGKLVLEEHSRTETLEMDQNRLVKKPGYEILMEKMDKIEFFNQEGKLYLRYVKNGHVQEFQIG